MAGSLRLSAPPASHALAFQPAQVVWAFAALLYLASLPLQVLNFDTDAMLRLQEVRDLFAGQSWWDVTQYRMGAPEGAAMHWSRLVDMPLVGVLWLFTRFMPQAQAEFGMLLIVPLLYLGAALALLQGMMRALGFSGRSIYAGLALAVLFPLLPPSFAPYQIDHHSAQAVAALVGALCFLKAPQSGAAIGGAIAAAVWMNISLEGLPAVAVFAACYGLRYWLVRDRSLVPFLLTLALAAPVLSLATRPVSELTRWCDILGPAHFAAFAAAGAWAAGLRFLPGQATRGGRFVALAAMAPLAGGAFGMLLGSCTLNPFASVDPLLDRYWYSAVLEGRPFWVQPLHTSLMMIGLATIVAVAAWVILRERGIGPARRLRWAGYLLLVAGCTAYGLVLLREMLVAQLFAIPVALALLVHLHSRIRRIPAMPLRVFAGFAALLFATPVSWTQLGQAGERAFPSTGIATTHVETNLTPVEAAATCNEGALDRLPQGHVFTTSDKATIILALTHHSVEMGGYHRNVAALRRVIEMYISPPAQARAIVKQRRTDYVAVCVGDSALYAYADGRPDSMAALILRGDVPDWLVPIPGFEADGLRVYRVR